MRIFDAHFHIDKQYACSEMEATHRHVIFNSVLQYQEMRHLVRDTDVVSLVFDYKNNLEFVQNEIAQKNINGIKIHSKIQGITEQDYVHLFDGMQRTNLEGMVVTVDAFYSQHNLLVQPNLQKISEMVQLFPKNNFVIAHSGGIHVLEYFMHLRTLPNVYFDLSFSLEYLKYASVMQDFKLLLRFGNPEKIIFGTDAPFISDKAQL